MDQNQEIIEEYKQQLIQINAAISNSTLQEEINSLISLKTDIQELLSLTDDTNSNQIELEDEYANFMAEMAREGAYGGEPKSEVNLEEIEKLKKELEGMKCKAPHKHSWGEITYHNAMICSVLYEDEIKVKVMFLNPTHLEMLPCPYFLDTECKFSEEKCRFSHGELVLYSEIKSYLEPKFENIKIGTKILAKKNDKLWYRGYVQKIYDEKCLVGFDSKEKHLEVEFKDLIPLDNNDDEFKSDSDDLESDDDDLEVKNDDKTEIINMSLMVKPTDEALGSWEKYTRGIGGKLMSKMGYIIGSGLGKDSNGRLEPVSAVILPPGKSLDHCMHLREKSGGDQNLFSVERKMKRLQKRQEKINEKLYEKERNKTDVFDFLNDTLTLSKNVSTLDKNNVQNANVKGNQSFRDEIKGETSRNLNVSVLKIEEEVKRIERELFKIKDSLRRHQTGSRIYESLMMKQHECLHQIKVLEERKKNINSEQNLRSDKKKLTVF